MHTMHPYTLDFKTIDAFDNFTGARFNTPAHPWRCFVEGDGDADTGDTGDGDTGDTGDDTPPEAKFTSADVEKLVKRRLTKANREQAKLQKAADKKSAELEARIAELSEQLEGHAGEETKKTSAQERELSKALARVKELDESLLSTTGERDSASNSLKSYIVRDKLRAALVASGVLPTALGHAVSLMSSEMSAELLDEDGEHVVVVKVDGKETDDLEKASAGWLKKHTHFASHPGGGTGETKPRGSNGTRNPSRTPEEMLTADPAALIAEGLNNAARK